MWWCVVRRKIDGFCMVGCELKMGGYGSVDRGYSEGVLRVVEEGVGSVTYEFVGEESWLEVDARDMVLSDDWGERGGEWEKMVAYKFGELESGRMRVRERGLGERFRKNVKGNVGKVNGLVLPRRVRVGGRERDVVDRGEFLMRLRVKMVHVGEEVFMEVGEVRFVDKN